MPISKQTEVYDALTGRFIPLPPVPRFTSTGGVQSPQDWRRHLKFNFSSCSQPPAPSAPCAAGAAPTPVGSAPLGGVFTAASGHLHYGGSACKTNGFIGVKPKAKTTFRSQKRLETIIRLENAAMPDHAIAAIFSITPQRLRLLKKTREYLLARQAITLGIIVDNEGKLEEIKSQRKEVLTAMLPPALQVIANALQSPVLASSLPGQKLQVAVAQDLLDREGTFAKISRSEVRPVDHFDWNAADEQGRSVFDVLKATRTSRASVEIEDTISLSRAFSASKTIDPIQQQQALEGLERESKAQLFELKPASEKVQ